MQKPSFGLNMTFQSAYLTLKISSRSPKPNQLFPPSQNKKYACLVKIHLLFQKITNRNKAAQTPAGTPKGSASKSLCPPCVGAGDINIILLTYVKLRTVHMTYLLMCMLIEYTYL